MESIAKKFSLGEVLLHTGEGRMMPQAEWKSAYSVTEVLLCARRVQPYFTSDAQGKLQRCACNIES